MDAASKFLSVKREDDEKKSDIIMSEASDFLTYVIKEWSDEMKTEQSIGFEFLTSRNSQHHYLYILEQLDHKYLKIHNYVSLCLP